MFEALCIVRHACLFAKSKITVVPWFAVMIALANCGSARYYNIGRTGTEIGD